jgi:exodeoxyribonuclease VII large subunit
LLADRLESAVQRQLDLRHQRLDQAAQRLGRPSGLAAREQLRLAAAQRLRHMLLNLSALRRTTSAGGRFCLKAARHCAAVRPAGTRRLRLELLDPRLVLQRGYALLTDSHGHAVTSVGQARLGDALRATLADGVLDVTVDQPRLL